jgi:hypothetical protein
LSCGKPFQALINLILTCFFWLPGVIHAILVVNGYQNDKRFKSLEKTIMNSAKGKTDTSAPVPIRGQNEIRPEVEASAKSSILLNSEKVRIKP